jgi:hypothetical protein
LGEESCESVFNYIADLLAHNLTTAPDSLTLRALEHSAIAPTNWTTKGLLIDQLRGESELLEAIETGERKVEVQWLIPITQDQDVFHLELASY